MSAAVTLESAEHVEQFARAMLSAATSTSASLQPVMTTAMRSRVPAGAAVSVRHPGVAMLEGLRARPASWAEQLVSAIDVAAPDAEECLELAFADTRLGVCRALAGVRGLPWTVMRRLGERAARCGDMETLAWAVAHEGAEPAAVASWVAGAAGVAEGLGAAVSAAVEVIRADVDVAAAVMSAAVDAEFAVLLLVASLQAEPATPTHFCDLVDVAKGRADDVVDRALLSVAEDPVRCDERMIDWLTETRAVRLGAGALEALADPVLIRAWWRSLVPGSRRALVDSRSLSSTVIASTLFDEVDRADQVLCCSLAAALCHSRRWLQASAVARARRVQLASWSLDLLEGVDPGEVSAESWQKAVSTVTKVVASVEAPARSEGELELMCRVAALLQVTDVIDSSTVTGFGLSQLRQRSAPPFAAAMVADPARFGLSAKEVASAAGSASGAWCDDMELWSALVVSLPGVVCELATTSAPLRPHLAAPVFAVLDEALGGSASGWDYVWMAAPTWPGSAVELAEVAATFA